MKSLLCCCYADNAVNSSASATRPIELTTATTNRKSDTTVSVSLAELQALERPSEINSRLEISINLWEQAISDYEELESALLDRQDTVVLAVLPALRSDPLPFLNSTNENIRNLAARRNQMFLKEKAIGTKSSKHIKTMDSSSALPTVRTVNVGGGSSSMGMSVNSFNEASQRLSSSSMQRRISKTWAAHMQEIDGTSSSNGKAAAGSTANAIGGGIPNASAFTSKIRPKWPDYLVDVSFEVLKVNSIGTKLRRTMKLTEYHILNIKEEGNQVSKVHKYTELSQIWLESANILKIKLKDGLVLTYISPIASHIVQQISTRVKTRLALNRTVFSDPVVNFEELPASIEHLIAAIHAENAVNSTSSMQSFANELAQRFAKPRARTSFGIDAVEEESSAMSYSAPSSASMSSLMSAKPKIHAFSDKMNEHTVQEFVRGIMFDAKTNEGNTRSDFVDTFLNGGKNLKDVRQFIDGMHNYILTSRGIELASKLVGLSTAIGVGNATPSAGNGMLQSYTFADKVNDDKDQRGQSGAVVSPLQSGEQSTIATGDSNASLQTVVDVAELDEASIASLSFIVFTVVEESLYVPLATEIKDMITSGQSNSLDEDFLNKLKLFSTWTQEDWGIKASFSSPLGWQNAIFELSAMDHHFTPSMHLLALSRCMNAIYSEYKLVVLPTQAAKGGSVAADSFLGADDLVPIFIYVLSKSKVQQPILYKDQMWALCHPKQLIGESGYYLTVLESAIEFISEADPNVSLKHQLSVVDTSEEKGDSSTDGTESKSRSRTESNVSDASVSRDDRSDSSSSATNSKGKSRAYDMDSPRASSFSMRPKSKRGKQIQKFD